MFQAELLGFRVAYFRIRDDGQWLPPGFSRLPFHQKMPILQKEDVPSLSQSSNECNSPQPPLAWRVVETQSGRAIDLGFDK
jgi:hypothetical protein